MEAHHALAVGDADDIQAILPDCTGPSLGIGGQESLEGKAR